MIKGREHTRRDWQHGSLLLCLGWNCCTQG